MTNGKMQQHIDGTVVIVPDQMKKKKESYIGPLLA